MKLVAFLLCLCASAQNLYMRPNDTFTVNVHLKVTSGTVTSLEWKANSGFPAPSIVKLIAQGTLSCKGNNLNCTMSALSLSGWDGPVAAYTFRSPATPGLYAIHTQSKAVNGGVGSLDLRSGVKLSISPGEVTIGNGAVTVTDPGPRTVVLGFTAPSADFTVRVQ